MGKKVSAMTVLSVPPPEAELVAAIPDVRDIAIPVGNIPSEIYLNRFTGGVYKDDFWNINEFHYPWRFQIVGVTGVLSAQTTIANHPGIVRFGANGATTGYMFRAGGTENNILIEGGEVTELIINFVTSANLVLYFGFGDNFNTSAIPTDGIFINVAGTTLDGRARNNGSQTITGTTYTISTGTWYRLSIIVSADASRVDFYVYDASGTQLWTDSVTSNIPTQRVTSHGVLALKTNAGAANLVDLDFMSLIFGKQLIR